MIQVRNLVKRYGELVALDHFDLDVRQGEIFGLLGPNGSGKTTVMKACLGLVAPGSGQVIIGGHDVQKEHESALQSVGALIEAPALFERLTARKNLELAAAYYPDLPKGRIDEVLELVELGCYEKDKVMSFSLGMRQRTGFALALLSKPGVLILDEPANGLDIEGMVAVRDMVKGAAADGAAVMISSHLANEIEQCATQVGIMHDGHLLKVAGMDEVLQVCPNLEDYYLTQVTSYRKGGAVA